MPEIQRANLAEVILRMMAYKLGDIESFPFINPPVHAAIRSGYQLLHELGALTDTHDMTPMGRELARLPLDPTLGRMLLQAQKEKALPEMLIIAAGLSVPDPRERPEEGRSKPMPRTRLLLVPTPTSSHCCASGRRRHKRMGRAAPRLCASFAARIPCPSCA